MENINLKIESIELAHKTAINWAIQNKQNIIDAQNYSSVWFNKTSEEYRNSIALKIQLEIFAHQKIQDSSYWKIATDEAWQKNSEWTLETVKHLAIINGAGLAGCSAILASSFKNSQIHAPFILFAIGLLLAVADLYACSRGYQSRGEKYSKLYYKIKYSKHDDEISSSIKETNLKKENWFHLSSVLGWSSVIMFISAGTLLSFALLK